MATTAIAHARAATIREAADGLKAPGGIFNLVLGQGGVGAAIADHPGIAGISFTGSQAVGAKVGMAAMARQARVQIDRKSVVTGKSVSVRVDLRGRRIIQTKNTT